MTTTSPAENVTAMAPQPPQPRPAAIVPHTDNDDASRALNAFGSAANFAHAQRMANLLSYSTMVPLPYQGEKGIANCVIALELAARIGASVFMVMQNLDIIHGRPGWRATFLIATVNASGRFTPLRFRWVGTRGKDDWGCYAIAKDRENGEPCEGSIVDIATAKAEGWYQKAGSKWQTIPQQMLMYRAAAFWTRVYAPELSLGMQTTDEAIDTYETTPGTFAPVVPGSEPTKTVEQKLAERQAKKATQVVEHGPSIVTEKQEPGPTAEAKAEKPSTPRPPSNEQIAAFEEHRKAIEGATTRAAVARAWTATSKAKLHPAHAQALSEAVKKREAELQGETDGEPPAAKETP